MSVGNINLDVSLILDRYPSIGVNIIANSLWFGVGGAASNYAVAVARLGHKASIISIVTPHMVNIGLLEDLKSKGVDTGFVKIAEGDPNIAVILMIPEESTRTIISHRGVSKLLNGSMIPDVGDHVHFASVPARIIIEAGGKLKPRTSSYDPGGEALRDPAGVREALAFVDWVFLNEKELEALTGLKSLDGALKLLDMGARMAIIKMGARGAIAVKENSRISVKAPNLGKPLDVVGTGDAFDASFNVYYKQTQDILTALKHGVAAGSLKTRLKGSSNMPSRDEIEKIAKTI